MSRLPKPRTRAPIPISVRTSNGISASASPRRNIANGPAHGAQRLEFARRQVRRQPPADRDLLAHRPTTARRAARRSSCAAGRRTSSTSLSAGDVRPLFGERDRRGRARPARRPGRSPWPAGRSRPDPARADRSVSGVLLRDVGDLLDELVVERLQLLLDLLALVGVVRPRRRVHLRVPADAGRLDARAELVVDAAGHELAAEDADRAGQRRRLRDDRPGPASRCSSRPRRPDRTSTRRSADRRARSWRSSARARCVGGGGRSARDCRSAARSRGPSVAARPADVLDERVRADHRVR